MRRRIQTIVILAAFFAVSSTSAHAEVSNLGEALNTFTSGTFGSVWGLIKALTIPMGVMMMVMGLVRLKDAGDQRGHGPMSGVIRIAAGAAMIATPRLTDTIAESVGIASLVGSKSSFDVGQMNGGGGDGSFLQMLGHFFGVVSSPLAALLIACTFVAGVCLIIKALWDCVALASQDGGRKPHFGGVVATFAVGAMLANFTTIMSIVSTSFGFAEITTSGMMASSSQAGSIMSYSGDAGSLLKTGGAAAKMLTYGLIPFGGIAFARGLMIMRRVADGNPRGETMAGAASYVVGGIALANALAVTCMFGSTLHAGASLGGMCG